jgi:hypothetical protein
MKVDKQIKRTMGRNLLVHLPTIFKEGQAMANIACRIFQEQLDLVKELPEQERATVLYTAICNAFNQFENHFDNQIENQNHLYLLSKSLSKESINVLNSIVILIGDLNKGENHWNWKNNKTPKNKKIRSSYKYQKWRKFVLERDNYKCTNCGAVEKLEVHHIKHFAKSESEQTDVNNGITLCKKCHINQHIREGF